ncbi:MAG: hypothetical protein JWN66_1518 [Sphingomonas bacterium]|uniref:hypothetical protein n=1 Tax=Sphingomonas bacterium TaxID=1895847 RepID=UPI002606ED5B|nr:hypothetical protein [Sphingomonas bacterium]MDB5704402.1 hypothetical protein [Sphingomonas bacterium]
MHFTQEQRDAWNGSTRDSPFNCWLRDRVNNRQGTLDLERLRSVAAEYGIDAAKYGHLNPGQQRMNIGNRLRRLVPPKVYMAASGTNATRPAPPVRVETVTIADPGESPAEPATPLSGGVTNRDLMRLYGNVIDELRERGVVRTGNAPLGDYAEHLFSSAFGWSLTSNSAAGYDAIDSARLRFQIKARRLRANVPGERQLSTLRAWPEAKFDMLAAVLFDKQFEVHRAALIPHSVALERAVFIQHVNGWRFILDDDVWDMSGVRDVTEPLRAAAAL